MMNSYTRTAMNHVYLLVVALIHIHVMFYKNNGTAEAKRPSSCPFKIATSFLERKTAFLAGSFLFRNPGAILSSSLKSDVNSFFHGSDIVRFAINPEKLAEIELGNPVKEEKFIPTSSFFNQNLDSYIPADSHTNQLYENENGKQKIKSLPDSSEPLEVIVIGLSHHNAKVEVREKLAIPEDKWNEAATELCEYPSIKEATVLSTCNRFEIYLSGPNQYEAIKDAVDYLHKRSGGALDHATLKKNLFMLAGEDAIWHLLRVSAGLDSLIVGEGQILAQVKRSYEHGLEKDVPVFPSTEDIVQDAQLPKPVKMVGGRGGKVLSRLLNTAVTAGKRVRSETEISKGAVSVSSAAAEFSALKLSQDCDIYSGLKDANIAIVGAGKMTRLLLNHLSSSDVKKVTIVNRSQDSVKVLQEEFPDITITYETMGELYNVLRDADIVFPSTSSMEPIIHPQPLMDSLSRRTRTGGLQLIDISVPRNVHADCASIVSVPVAVECPVASLSAAASPTRVKVACYNVDHLNAVVNKNTAKRRKEMIEAEYILKEEMSKFRKWQQSLGAIPTITKLQHKAETMRLEELAKTSKKLSSLSPKDFDQVNKMTKLLVAKLLHGPMSHLRTQNEGSEATQAAVKQITEAFRLNAEEA